jgi:hypothetical protein
VCRCVCVGVCVCVCVCECVCVCVYTQGAAGVHSGVADAAVKGAESTGYGS